jgi:hypothetical protein
MDIHEASGIILRTVHEDLEGKLYWSAFLQKKTMGYGDQAANEIRGTYSKALIILIDEGLCKKLPGTDIVELGQKGIEANGDFRKYLKKKKTIVTLEKIRRVAPIVSMVIVIISFIITMITRNAKKNAAPQKPTTTHNKEKEGRR